MAEQDDHGGHEQGPGLTDQEATVRRTSTGVNELAGHQRSSLLRAIVRRFASPLVAILLAASVLSAALGDRVNAALILVIVVTSVVVELVQVRRSERAADALQRRVAHTATVCRDGIWCERSPSELVLGDWIRLSAGDLVPADARLVEAKDLHLNEAALTGEWLPVEKARGAEVLLGSSVVSGHGLAEVVRTGSRTTYGGIARSLADAPPPTEFERGVARLGRFILRIVVALVFLVFLVSTVMRRDPLQSLLFAVALAVGLTPEFLPMITTLALTRGALRLERSKVIVKNVASIQNIGSLDVLACDKTGTLTTGEMRLAEHVDATGRASDRPLHLAYVNSFFETGVEHPADVALRRHGHLDPLDQEILQHEHEDVSGYRKVDEIPFDFERRRVTIVARRDQEMLLVTKGSPESVLSVCFSWECDGQVQPLGPGERVQALAVAQSLAARGQRVLAVAYSHPPLGEAFSLEDEVNLTLAGFLAFADPPRPDAASTLVELRQAGVTVKLLTGDSREAAEHLCEAVGLTEGDIIVGSEVDALDDDVLVARVRSVRVFARVTPAQKTRIVRALQAAGSVVGFLGDGINDAPSLHVADVGISVDSAVDVAKEAADIILLEPGLSTVVTGVREGRRAFANVMKYLLMGTSSSFGNVLSMAVATVALPFLPMLPTQILLNNFLYDLAQVTIPGDRVDEEMVRLPRRWDIAQVERLMLTVGPVSSLYDLLTFWALRSVMHANEEEFHTGWFVESLATQTLVILVIRTAASPLRSRPSRALLASVVAISAIGAALPFAPFARALGFVPLPATFYLLLGLATATYLSLVQLVKSRALPGSPREPREPAPRQVR